MDWRVEEESDEIKSNPTAEVWSDARETSRPQTLKPDWLVLVLFSVLATENNTPQTVQNLSRAIKKKKKR